MDVLAHMMSLMRTKGSLYGRLEFTAPFGFWFPADNGVCIIVTRGSCFLSVDDSPLVSLVGGDFVFLPTPKQYTLRSSPELSVRSMLEVASQEEFHRTRLITFDGGQGPSTSIVAGCFSLASPESDILVKHLPPIVHLQGSGNHTTPWFQSTLQFIASEVAQNLPGGTAIVDRLAEVLFVQAMRSRIGSSSPTNKPSWLHALNDPQIGEAIQLMHAEPGRPWTLDELARNVSMSRSAFAERFRKLVGETPLDHLTQWRMVKAGNMMRANPPIKLAEIALATGYESESSFGKAFRRIMGVSPGKYRASNRDLAEV
ncbi:AraC family transcriptional regulator [Phragmitibacter flavus]|uniref:AraC family transcriptional regulator n=2 Tax=Phragmitibacter flavus TaxID=2576071 RepID=A0A5R8KKL2_9BACT|nr:AraC family transcriptional regulator [Phragmitibacter flavus]